MTLLNPDSLPGADEGDLYEALSALNAELRRRIDTDGGLAAAVRALLPTATGVLCDVDWSDYVTAAPRAVLLADGTTVDVDRWSDDDTAQQLWSLTCDEVANLAAVDGAISDDCVHGPVVRFDPVADATPTQPPADAPAGI